MACWFLTQRLIVACLAPARTSFALGTRPPSPSVHAATRGAQPQFDLVEHVEDTFSLGGVQPAEDLCHGLSDHEANRRSKQP